MQICRFGIPEAAGVHYPSPPAANEHARVVCEENILNFVFHRQGRKDPVIVVKDTGVRHVFSFRRLRHESPLGRENTDLNSFFKALIGNLANA